MPDTDTVSRALGLPYSIGSQRLLREILSSVTGVTLPPDPSVRHGPVKQVRGVKRATVLPASERREQLLEALRRGPVTQADGLYDWLTVISDIGVLRDRGYPVRNAGNRRRAVYVMEHRT